MFFRSIRWKIQAWHGLLLVLITGALLAGFYHYEKRSQLAQVDDRLQQTMLLGRPALTPMNGQRREPPPPGPDGYAEDEPPAPPPVPRNNRPQGNRRNFLLSLEGTPIYYAVWHGPGERSDISANAPGPIPRPVQETAGTLRFRDRGALRELIDFGPRDDAILFGHPLTGVQRNMQHLALILTGVGAGVVGAGLLGGWWLASRALQPIRQISRAAEQIADGDRARRIDLTDTSSELGGLAATLNSTFDRLGEAYEQQVRFTADASHELRTPVSVILSQTQMSLSRERSPEDYRAALEACQRAGQRMRLLVNDLLDLARYDSGEAPLQFELCDLTALVRETAEYLSPLAESCRSDVQIYGPSLIIPADAGKLAHALQNIVSNAIRHTPEGTLVEITTAGEEGAAVIRVRDHGPGIPPDALPHVFDRFYRVDTARARTAGSTGLGLAITRAIITAHRGTITAACPPDGGTLFTVRLPLVQERNPSDPESPPSAVDTTDRS